MDIENYKKKIEHFFSHLHHGGKEIDPYRDWAKLLIFFATTLLVVVAFNTYLFYKINRGEIFKSNKVDVFQTETVDREKLKATVDYYRSRAERFEAVKNQSPAVVDPSR